MNTFLRLFILALLFCLCSTFTYANAIPKDGFSAILEATEAELAAVNAAFEGKIMALSSDLKTVNLALSAPHLTTDGKMDLLLQKIKIQENIQTTEVLYDLNMERVRYEKGIELIKMMYEKILGLDHHFTSLQTYQSINQMSNPASYPEFQKAKDVMEQRLKKNNAVRLPALLSTNPFLSASFSLVASLVGEGQTKEKEEDLSKVACILDFTVRMNADLSLIYYETEYLKESNKSLKEDCLLLFDKYSQVVNYNVPLDKCRKTDDWEVLDEKLDAFIFELEEAAKLNDPTLNQKVHKGVVNIEFAVDQMLDFLDKYSMFINQGEKYYQKFHVIVSNYQNEVQCAGQLPHQYDTLKKDINFSIEKFNEAYNIAELKGSRLKDLLYGAGG